MSGTVQNRHEVAGDARGKAAESQVSQNAGLTVTRISPALGAEVVNIDLRTPLPEETIAEVRRLLLAHRVLIFRDQDISPAQHVEFARRFGELEVHPVYPNHDEHAELVLLEADKLKPGAENVFHTDVTWRELPSMGSVLRCVECPAMGGDTIWTNMVIAYERLPSNIKEQIAELRASHDIMPSFGGQMSDELRRETRLKFPSVEHPIVRTHPETGEKLLFVNQAFTTHISNWEHVTTRLVGRERKQLSDALLTYLYHQAEIPEYQMRLRWRPNTIAFWDNRSTQHYAVQDYFPQARRMIRATIIGDRPH